MKSEDLFVEKTSIVRKIWSRSDVILFIFAGAAAEFALNKAVDWLYFTGKLPADPLGRLFSTVSYARKIIFSSTANAHQAIDTIRHIHHAVEDARGAAIPDWAYRDVLFLLVHYSIASYELFAHQLNAADKEELYQVFRRVGDRMGVRELPPGYGEWLPVRAAHLAADLQRSTHTDDLFRQYKKHLGPLRFSILIAAQQMIVPDRVRVLLGFRHRSPLALAMQVYRLCRVMEVDGLLRRLLMPPAFRAQLSELDVDPYWCADS